MDSVTTEEEAEDFLDQCPETSTPAEGSTTAPATASDFFPLSPCRLVDTRSTNEAVESATERMVNAAGSGCGIPATARALSLNVTVTVLFATV